MSLHEGTERSASIETQSQYATELAAWTGVCRVLQWPEVARTMAAGPKPRPDEA